MERFELHFLGNETTPGNFETGMKASGDFSLIGRIFAEYAVAQFREHGQVEPMRVLISAFENVARLMPDLEKQTRGIIQPFFKH